ncbi:hypothetical protein YC2023_064942 [Brassica napus]
MGSLVNLIILSELNIIKQSLQSNKPTSHCFPWLNQLASPCKFQLHAGFVRTPYSTFLETDKFLVEIGRSGSHTTSSRYNTVWSFRKGHIRHCRADQTSDHSTDIQTVIAFIQHPLYCILGGIRRQLE